MEERTEGKRWMSKLRDDFLWGGAVTAHQTEGAYDLDGKAPAVCDLLATPGKSTFKEGIDSYHRFEEDFALLEKLGVQCFRFSVDWSRIAPDGKTINEKGLEFYDRFLDSMIAHHIEPMCSLYHFEMPLSLMEEKNGFYSREVTEDFVKLGEMLIDRWHDKIKLWISFNEQNSIGQLGSKKTAYGALKPEDVSEEAFVSQLVHNTFVAHAKIARKVHSYPDLKILGMVIYIPVYPLTCAPEDQLHARNEMANQEMYFDMCAHGRYSNYMLAKWKKEKAMPVMEEGDLELLENNTCDWLSFSYYFSTVTAGSDPSVNMDGNATMAKNPYLQASEFGWQIDPIGMELALLDLEAKYHMPVMVVENGYGAHDEVVDGQILDDYRIEYMRDHIQAIKNAVAKGSDVRGYLMWAPIDILSSHADMDKRYGVIYVNRDNHDLKDMKRIPKKSFAWFQNVIASNGETL